MTREELAAVAAGVGEPTYRAGQLFSWLYTRGATTFAGMTDLGKELRRRLEATAEIRGIAALEHQQSSHDATTKFLFALRDGLKIESVLIPPASAFRRGGSELEEEQKRLTLCVSTQVGCPLDCAFCATGTMGFLRNLSAGEIIDQLLQVRRTTGKRITNVVFMGMGEPLLNYDAVMKASDIMTEGAGIAARRITVSTAGRADMIRRLGDERRKIKLAVSLHSAVDATRMQLMPIGRKFNLDSLLGALEHYYRRTRERVTYEVIFFDGLNDSDADVKRLIALARRVPSKINVIPYHSIAFTRPTGFAASLAASPRMEVIVETLRAAHLTVMVRSSAGEDIAAACGQLAVAASRTQRQRNMRTAAPALR